MDNEQLPKGYKNTEVGVIPEDWEVKELGNCLLRNPDYGLNAAAVTFDDTLPTYLRITDISDDGRFISAGKASVKNIYSNNYYLEKGDIVFARTGASVGKTYLYNENDGKLVFAGFLIRIKPNPEIVDCNYLIYLTQTKKYWAWVSANSMRSGQPGLNSNEYKSFQISLPPTKTEQTAIATALSDTDALINSLEKLIAKKRNIKQGAMQQLLKPQEGWEVKKLGEVAEIYQPQTISQDVFIDDGYLVYGANGIVGKYHLYNHETWQTTITCRGSTCGTVNRTVGKSWITGNAMVMNVDKNTNIDKLFFYYILTKQDFSQCITGSGQPQIVRNPLFEFKVSIPKTNEEQTRIATILSDMDAEITALETKLEKFRKVKLGMMQNLLTGKIRLV